MVLLRLLLLIQFMNENQKCNSALKSLACNYTYAHMLFFGCFKHSFSASKIAFAAANCLHELMCAWAYVVLTSQVGVKFAKSKSSGQYDRATQNRIDWRGHRTFDVFFISFAIPVVIDQLRACAFVTHPIIALTFLRAIFRKRASRTPSNCGWTVAPPGADQSTIVASL